MQDEVDVTILNAKDSFTSYMRVWLHHILTFFYFFYQYINLCILYHEFCPVHWASSLHHQLLVLAI